MKRKTQFKSVKTRFTFWFLLVALLPLIIVCKVNYDLRVKSIKSREINKLIAIRDLKAQELNSWLDDKISYIQAITEDHNLRDLEIMFNTGERTQDDLNILNKIRHNLTHFERNSEDFYEIYIINATSGKVEVSTTDKSLEGLDRSKRTYFTEALRTARLYIDTYYSKYLNKPAMTFSIPIYCLAHSGKHIVAILAARLNLEDSLYELLLNRTGLGETGETLIVDKDAVALNKLMWHEKAPFNLKIKGEPAVRALQGKDGIAEITDYRGEKVLAAYTYIPRTRWGFVAKQDLREIYAPIKILFLQILILLLISATGVYVIVVFVTNNITRPVLEMTEVSKRIEGGEVAARNHVLRADEFGYLAQSFNSMADSIMQQMVAREGGADITRTMVAAGQLADFGSGLLKKLIEITGSNFGAFYVRGEEDGKFEHLTSIGVNPKLLEPFDAQKGEGEFGRALAAKRIVRINHIPQDTVFTFKTFVGTAHPKEIITIPLMVKEKVMAIISLASLSEYSKEGLEILDQTWLGMNTALSNQLANARTQKLAEELSLKNRQLERQTEELQTQAEELQVQTEELQQQSEELQQQNVELEAQRQQVEEANRLKSVFLSNMSHELRTPLNSVMALSRVLLMQARPKLSEEEGKYLEIIERNGRNLLALINDLLDLSKIEAGRMELNPRLFSPASTIEMIAERLEPIAREKGIEIRQDIHDDLPLIESDEERVHQILQNIIGNAVKFTEQGSITVSAYGDAQKVYIRVADTGSGIPKEDLQYIFKEFQQIDGSSSRPYEGTGLGLAIAARAAKMMSGEISVESALGQGSTFTLILPIKWQAIANDSPDVRPSVKIQSEPKTLIEQYPKHSGPSEVKTGSRILLVEDSEAAIIQVKTVLENEGFIVDAAHNGQKALDYVKQSIPDGIILDLMMPKVDGFEVLEKIRSTEATAKIPVLILTAMDLTRDDLKKLKANHIQQLIQKGDVDREGLLCKTKLMLGAGGRVKSEASDKDKHKNKEIGRPVVDKKEFYTIKDEKGSPTILVVEDNPDNMITIRSVLKDKYKIMESTDGEEGLKLALANLPDLVLLDIALPKLEGLTVVRRIKDDKKACHIPVIALTAHAMKGDREKIMEAGCDDYISKPIDPEHVLRKIGRWVSR